MADHRQSVESVLFEVSHAAGQINHLHVAQSGERGRVDPDCWIVGEHEESDLGTIRPGVFTNMTNIGRVSFVNNKIDAIDSLELNAANRVRQFHFIGNHLLDLPAPRSVRIHGVGNVTVTGNHFPCDCRLNGWLGSSLFADQNKDHVINNNFCISPYEVHGKSVMAAAGDLSLLEACPPDAMDVGDDEADEIDDGPLEPTDATLSSGSCSPTSLLSLLVAMGAVLTFQL